MFTWEGITTGVGLSTVDSTTTGGSTSGGFGVSGGGGSTSGGGVSDTKSVASSGSLDGDSPYNNTYPRYRSLHTTYPLFKRTISYHLQNRTVLPISITLVCPPPTCSPLNNNMPPCSPPYPVRRNGPCSCVCHLIARCAGHLEVVDLLLVVGLLLIVIVGHLLVVVGLLLVVVRV